MALYVVSGPSGAGKATLLQSLAAVCTFVCPVSATTRQPRPGEVEGKSYYFISLDEFGSRKEAGEFAECFQVHGNWYGTLRSELERPLAGGRDVVLEIDTKGALRIKELYPEAILIFITVPEPEIETLRARLTRRGDTEDIEPRLNTARRELALADYFDIIVVNDDAKRAAGELANVFSWTHR